MSAAKLIDELYHNAAASGNRPLERRLADTAIWFYQNKGRIPMDNLAAKQAFLEQAFWIQVEINALLLERIREMGGSQGLWLPKGLDVKGDLRSFG